MATAQSVSEHRQVVADLTVLVVNDLVSEWRTFGHADAPATTRQAEALLADLAEDYGRVAGGFAADWYEDVRAEAGVRGRFVAAPAGTAPVEQVAALARWGVEPLWSRENPDPELALSRLSGSAQRLVVNADRETVMHNTKRDPQAERWYRHASANACAFCALVATRGAVYRTESTASFRPHNHCHCIAVPQFKGEEPELPDYYQQWAAGYEQAAAEAKAAGQPVRQETVLPRLRVILGAR